MSTAPLHEPGLTEFIQQSREAGTFRPSEVIAGFYDVYNLGFVSYGVKCVSAPTNQEPGR